MRNSSKILKRTIVTANQTLQSLFDLDAQAATAVQPLAWPMSIFCFAANPLPEFRKRTSFSSTCYARRFKSRLAENGL
jgi:hypothetical protein